MDVVVLGSLNMDLVAQVDQLPLPGETILGKGFVTAPGGKGANQAVAAARLGAKTAMIGRVGADDFGMVLRNRLMAENIDVRGVLQSEQSPSGTALISVSPRDNQIIVVAGANGEVDEEELAELMPLLSAAKVLLLQFEIPLPIVEKAAALAHQAGLTVIVDPAPAQGLLATDFCDFISILTPNQTEASVLTGQAVENVQGAIAAAEILQQKGIPVVIVKMGAMGCVCATANGTFAMPAFPVNVVDSVAAGDAFNGGLAAALCNFERQLDRSRSSNEWNLSDHDILRPVINYASAVAALAVTLPGAQSSMPTEADVLDFIKIQPFEVGPLLR